MFNFKSKEEKEQVKELKRRKLEDAKKGRNVNIGDPQEPSRGKQAEIDKQTGIISQEKQNINAEIDKVIKLFNEKLFNISYESNNDREHYKNIEKMYQDFISTLESCKNDLKHQPNASISNELARYSINQLICSVIEQCKIQCERNNIPAIRTYLTSLSSLIIDRNDSKKCILYSNKKYYDNIIKIDELNATIATKEAEEMSIIEQAHDEQTLRDKNMSTESHFRRQMENLQLKRNNCLSIINENNSTLKLYTEQNREIEAAIKASIVNADESTIEDVRIQIDEGNERRKVIQKGLDMINKSTNNSDNDDDMSLNDDFSTNDNTNTHKANISDYGF